MYFMFHTIIMSHQICQSKYSHLECADQIPRPGSFDKEYSRNLGRAAHNVKDHVYQHKKVSDRNELSSRPFLEPLLIVHTFSLESDTHTHKCVREKRVDDKLRSERKTRKKLNFLARMAFISGRHSYSMSRYAFHGRSA